MAAAAAATTTAPAPVPSESHQLQQSPQFNNQEKAMDFDELSGRTIAQPGPWKEMLSARRRTPPQAHAQTSGKPITPLRAPPAPRLPEMDYKVIFRPRDGLRLASWSDRQITAGIQAASAIPEGAFNQQVVIQVQAVQNLIVASTPNAECADALSDVTSIQLGAVTYTVLPYVKHFPGTVKGVIHGLDPGTTTEQLPYIIASSGPRIVQARMLGKSTSAVVTFEGPHVPFYIRAHGMHTRCRPYRRSIQCCTLCGDIGHRRDVCPTPDVTTCAHCHERDPSQDHVCNPKCKLCGLAHPTASKECRQKLRPPPPPIHVRERLARVEVLPPLQPPLQTQTSHPLSSHYQPGSSGRRQQPMQLANWSAVVASGIPQPGDFPPLPAQPVLTQAPIDDPRTYQLQRENAQLKKQLEMPAPTDDPRMQQLQQENAQLRKQLEMQAARTENLERRIEELLARLTALQAPPAQQAPEIVTPSNTVQPTFQAPETPDLVRIEHLIRSLSETMERRITALEQRQEAAESVKRKTRKKNKHQSLGNSTTAPNDNPTNDPPSQSTSAMASEDEW